MKKLSRALFVIGAIAITGMIIFAVTTLARQALGSGTKTAKATCTKPGTEYVVAIRDDQPTINDIQAKLCDTLTIVNEDDRLRFMAFGVHERHKTYNGITERNLEQGDQFSVVLNETGTFTFHDHLRDTFTATFTVQ